MKKRFFSLILLCAVFPLFSACKTRDYSSYLSEVRSDLFVAETDEFSIILSCVSREYPYFADGVPSARSDLVEISLKDYQNAQDYHVYLCGERELGGEMSFRNVHDDFFYSEGVSAFPENTVSLRVEWGEEVREIAATSVKNEKTLSATDALARAIETETERIRNMEENGAFRGEFYVRLLRRERNYYYVGIVDGSGKTLSLLLDAESGEILAKRENE